MGKRNKIKMKWDWKIFLIILFLVLWLWISYDYSILEERSKNLLNDYNNLNERLEEAFTCEEGSKAYCYRSDYNVGACLNNERVVCQK